MGEAAPSFQYGGQAVIEGVMMRGPTDIAIAVRRPGGGISIYRQQTPSLSQRYPWLGWPIIRGCVALGEALVLGIQGLSYSATQAGEEDEQLSSGEMALTIVLALVVAVGLFAVLPVIVVRLVEGRMPPITINLVEGLVRIGLFLGYLVAINQMREIRRVFAYHGAEHKVIFTWEAGEELTPANARKYSTLHPRCGTNFILVVLLISIIAFSIIETPSLGWRILSRVLLLPIIAGVSYEVIKWAGRNFSRPWVRWIIAPGLWLQRLTTQEPDDGQLEIAICALKEVLKLPAERLN